MRKLICLLSVVFISLCVGCASEQGARVDSNKVSQIKKGVTTKDEVVQMLGDPVSVSMLPGGGRMMLYMHNKITTQGQSFVPYVGMFTAGGNTERQTLQISINKDGIVEDYEFSDRQGTMTNNVLGSSQQDAEVKR
ncbi:outer membrane protein assembly factor BamE [Candidatus Parcubacteria bacterium]|nr:outer membrane protein assembly factor BamE [Candidatus Parcubacteria bacterium]